MIRLALLAVLLVSPISARAGSVCPTNTAWGYGPGGSYEYQHSGPTWDESIYGGHVAYDLIVGTFAVSGGGGGGKQSGGAELHFSDVYQIVGPASATPIPFQVVAHLAGNLSAGLGTYPVIGTVCNSSSTSLNVASGPTNNHVDLNSYSPACTPVVVDDEVSIDLQKLPGEAFTVRFDLGVSGSATGSLNGTFAFVGLPAGYSVTSCQGYSSPPTPVSATTWGSLKASYR